MGCAEGGCSNNENSSQPCGCDPGCKPTPYYKDDCHVHRPFSAAVRAEIAHRDRLQEIEEQRELIKSGKGWSTLITSTKAQIGIGGAPTRATTLPEDPKERKTYPIASGLLDYFPDALAAVSHVSWRGNEQHNPGQPLHWARGKSTDEADTMLRHFLERGTLDKDGIRHSAKMVWRALAFLQKEIEQEGK